VSKCSTMNHTYVFLILFFVLNIRLSRVGRKHVYQYQIIVQEKAYSPKSGRYTEKIGYFDATTKSFTCDKERLLHWIGVGAQPTQRIVRLGLANGISELEKFQVRYNSAAKKKNYFDKKQKEEQEKKAEEASAEETTTPAA
jgi:small subunit ribosomal protein S16